MLTAASAGSYQSSFITAGALLILGGVLTFFIDPMHRVHHVISASEVVVAADPAAD
jgi:hypothetical protein